MIAASVQKVNMVEKQESREGYGIFARAFARLFLKSAHVRSHDVLAPGFHRVELAGNALKGVRWTPGSVIQIGMSAFSARTFTPITWNPDRGETCFVGFAHGDGPASDWLIAAEPGQSCDFFGPRAAIELGKHPAPRFLFGDETSLGLALAATRFCSGHTICLLEVNSLDRAKQALGAVTLRNIELIERRDDETHMARAVEHMSALSANCETFILTGKAGSIQRMRRALKSQNISSSRIAAKVHWAPGKTGLD